MARVSVIIPSYNAGRFLTDAIDSVCVQTLQPDEIIVVDDASTDGAFDVRDDQVCVLRLPTNRGPSGARNEGLRVATGDFVAWLDADDAWEPYHLERLAPLLEQNPEAVLAFSRSQIVGEEGEIVGEWPALIPAGRPVCAFELSMRRCIVPHNSVVVRREAVLAIGGYDERLRQAEDFDLWLRLSHRFPFVCTHDLTSRLRRHPGQASSSLERYWMGEYDSRRFFLDARRAAGDPALPRIEQAILSAWLYHLDVAWWNRRRDWYDLHLGQASWIPGAAAHLPVHRGKRRLLPMARMWDATPHPLRQVMRRVRRLLTPARAVE